MSGPLRLKLLVSPLAKGAYFDAYLDVAEAEFRVYFPGLKIAREQVGALDFLVVELEESSLPAVARLSFVQGVFRDEGVQGIVPLALADEFLLPDALVFGAKYQGKTNELVTQLAINLALRFCTTGRSEKSLLDPMAGKGTTLFWGLRYGLDSTGIEVDPGAPQALHSHLKKQTKLHRIKHSHSKGFVGKKNKRQDGRFFLYEMAGHRLRLITGDSRRAPNLLSRQRFDMIVSDLPYGVRFTGNSRRSPIELIQACAKGWVSSLREGGAMVLVYNSYQPKRDELAAAFAESGCRIEEFRAPHRMSESIVRDVMVLTRTS